MRTLPLLLLILSCAMSVPVTAGELGTTEPRPPAPGRTALAQLDQKILSGQASFAEVRTALANADIGALTNTVHSLYSMRWHRGVYNLLHDMWALRPESFPELQWKQFAKAPVRLALASTLLRIEPLRSQEYVAYLREHARDEHEFHRAQVLIGLAFKGDPKDVPYMLEMASADNPFVIQTAITALGIVNLPPAHAALEELQKKFAGDARARLARDVLQRAYGAGAADEKLWREMTRGGEPAAGREVTPAPSP